MQTDPVESYADNWDYLRAELRWLDQVLMLAVARQRKETTHVDRLAQSQADKATSHWWKGIITLDGSVAYDEYRQPQSSGAKTTYQQQIEQRVQVSQKRGVALALPALRERLGLTSFEKNLVLMSLAPEVNRRYVRLYHYLQGDQQAPKTDLPTLDLVLRLLCRNDSEWRSARQRLTASSPLMRYGLLELLSSSNETLLCRSVKLADPLINYLLAEQPTASELDALLRSSPPPPTHSSLLQRQSTTASWADLVLPAPLRQDLQSLAQRIRGYFKVKEVWGIDPHSLAAYPGTIALFVGDPGTGKSMASAALADVLEVPLCWVDLTLIDPSDYPQLLEEMTYQSPAVLLIKSAHLWFGRASLLAPATLQQFLVQRRSVPSLTLLSATQQRTIQRVWQQQVNTILPFPLPDAPARLRLWQQAFSPQVPLDPEINWPRLAEQFALSGGTIAAIAYETTLYAAAIGAKQITITHIIHGLAQKGIPLAVQAPEMPLLVVRSRGRGKG